MGVGLFECDSGGKRGHLSISYTRNAADLTLRIMLSVTELSITGILYLKIVLIALR